MLKLHRLVMHGSKKILDGQKIEEESEDREARVEDISQEETNQLQALIEALENMKRRS